MVDRRSDYDQFEASELYCATCKRSRPVHKRLLMVLPTGNRYDYLCSVCGSSVGDKTDNDASDFNILFPH
ncbi:MAG: hypothetical protein ACE5EG_02060 [Thermoanaerobaculia bacterium]